MSPISVSDLPLAAPDFRALQIPSAKVVTPTMQWSMEQKVGAYFFEGDINLRPNLETPIRASELPVAMQLACEDLKTALWPTSGYERRALQSKADSGDPEALAVLNILNRENVGFNGKNNISLRGGIAEIRAGDVIEARPLEYAFIKAYSTALYPTGSLEQLMEGTPRLAGAGIILVADSPNGLSLIASIKGRGQAGDGQVLGAASGGGISKEDFSDPNPVLAGLCREANEELGLNLSEANLSRQTLFIDDLQTGNGSFLKIGYVKDFDAFLDLQDRHLKACVIEAQRTLEAKDREPTDDAILRMLEGGLYMLPGGFRLYSLQDGFAADTGRDFLTNIGGINRSNISESPIETARGVRPQTLGVFGFLNDHLKDVEQIIGSLQPL